MLEEIPRFTRYSKSASAFHNVTNTSMPFTATNFSSLEQRLKDPFITSKLMLLRNTNILQQLMVNFHKKSPEFSFPYSKPWFKNDEVVYPKFLACAARFINITATLSFANRKLQTPYHSKSYEKSHSVVCVSHGEIVIVFHDKRDVYIPVKHGECFYAPIHSKYYMRNSHAEKSVFFIRYSFNYVASMETMNDCKVSSDWSAIIELKNHSENTTQATGTTNSKMNVEAKPSEVNSTQLSSGKDNAKTVSVEKLTNDDVQSSVQSNDDIKDIYN